MVNNFGNIRLNEGLEYLAVRSIIGAIYGGIINGLVTDSETPEAILAFEGS